MRPEWLNLLRLMHWNRNFRLIDISFFIFFVEERLLIEVLNYDAAMLASQVAAQQNEEVICPVCQVSFHLLYAYSFIIHSGLLHHLRNLCKHHSVIEKCILYTLKWRKIFTGTRFTRGGKETRCRDGSIWCWSCCKCSCLWLWFSSARSQSNT